MPSVTHANGHVNGRPHASGHATGSPLVRPDTLNLHATWRALEDLHADVARLKGGPAPGADAPLFKVVLAVVAGCITPVLALAMSTLTGTVADVPGPAAWFALLPAAVLACLLVVSTPHVYEAKRQLGWLGWQAWAFAVGLDCAIVVSELLAVWCGQALGEVWWLPKLVIFAAVAYSATLNSYVNLRHAGWSRVTDPRQR